MNPIDSVHIAPTSTVRPVPGRFERVLRGAVAGLAEGVASGLDLASPFVPAGNVLSAAGRTAGAAALGDAAGAGTGTGTGTGTGDGDVLAATRALQQQSQSFNLQYLQLQEDTQRESRTFAALSNVMKVKHESAQGAIQNIR